MKYWKLIITNLFTLLVFFVILGIASTKFEKVIISLLLMIWVNQISSFNVQNNLFGKSMQAFDHEFMILRNLINPSKFGAFLSSIEEHGISERNKKSDEEFNISAIFNFILYVVACISLILAIFS